VDRYFIPESHIIVTTTRSLPSFFAARSAATTFAPEAPGVGFSCPQSGSGARSVTTSIAVVNVFIATSSQRGPGSRKAESAKDPDHVDVVRAGRGKDTGRGHARQELLAKTLGNPIPSVDRNDEDPAKLELVFSRADACVRLLEDVVPIPLGGRL
jgi:hypothetical protein